MPRKLAKLKLTQLKPLAVIAAVATMILIANTALAADISLDSPQFQPLGDRTIQQLIGKIIRGILALTGVLALVMFIYGGLMWMTAQGNADQIGKAKKTIVWSVLGLLIIFSSYALVNFVLTALRQT